MDAALQALQQRLGYRYTRPELLRRALTHRSWGAEHNERLEFLGDAVLALAVSRLLYERLPDSDEGELTRVRAHLVREDSLHRVALSLGLPEVLRLSEGEARGGGAQRPSILADAVEALIGAVFLEGGYEAAHGVVQRLFGEVIVATEAESWGKDAKTELQEWLQARRVPVPAYRITATRGQAHAQTFEVECAVAALGLTENGEGRSRRSAEQEAARRMLEALKASDKPGGPLALMNEPGAPQRCGLVAIVGRPNVGKSTLLNALVGQKISITSNKAQTTRHRITGITTQGAAQFVFVDTPGFQVKHGTALNRTLNRTVLASLGDVDVVLFVVEAGRFGPADAKVLALMPPGKPVLLVANKLDALARRNDVLPWLKQMQERHAFAEFVPMSATREADVQRLLGIVEPYLPEQPWLYEEDALTDRSERFLAGEIVREKLFRLTGDELPYAATVVIDKFEEEGNLRRIAATIVVEREAHKGMIIGEGGERLKRIGSEARQDLERLWDAKVFLELWVKVRSGWADDEAHLRSYGYE